MLVRLATRTLVGRPGVPAGRQLATTTASAQQQQKQQNPSKASSPFDSLDILPLQRPDTSAYFMSNPKYADLLSAITSMVQQNQQPAYNKCYFKRGKWIGRRAFEVQHSIRMNATEYTMLLERLNQADSLIVRRPEEKHNIGLYLNQFRKGYSHEEVVGADGVKKEVGDKKNKKDKDKVMGSWKRGAKDALGRWRAAGKRKQAVAVAWVVPVEGIEAKAEPEAKTEAKAEANAKPAVAAEAETKAAARANPEVSNPESSNAEAANAEADSAPAFDLDDPPTPMFSALGQVLINGRPLPEYFVRGTDRDSVLFPFNVTNKTGQYNVFVRVRGGGHTGQAEACQLAIARALYAVNRKEHAAIRSAGILFTDGRRVERKKTGKPKARKSYTWVKR
ncbi:37S ribosomal protein S9, mitochondrial [Coemansia sp. RSA 486]|nr:37S ribosomal protein S9, mitochondrial [Coemansia sp. RSA 486]KAJ2227581.1 37S ribosomal protein S9, mitochondrial [Coemansia sp. RSA 485]